jgi:hypothetical protein
VAEVRSLEKAVQNIPKLVLVEAEVVKADAVVSFVVEQVKEVWILDLRDEEQLL